MIVIIHLRKNASKVLFATRKAHKMFLGQSSMRCVESLNSSVLLLIWDASSPLDSWSWLLQLRTSLRIVAVSLEEYIALFEVSNGILVIFGVWVVPELERWVAELISLWNSLDKVCAKSIATSVKMLAFTFCNSRIVIHQMKAKMRVHGLGA